MKTEKTTNRNTATEKPFEEMYKERLAQDLCEYTKAQGGIMLRLDNSETLETVLHESLGVVRFARFTGTIDSLQEFLLVNTLTNLYEELTDLMEENENEEDN